MDAFTIKRRALRGNVSQRQGRILAALWVSSILLSLPFSALAQVSSLTPFTCSSDMFQVYSADGALGKLDFANEDLEVINPGPGYKINAFGYNINNNLAYGIRKSNDHLVALGQNGNVVDVGAVTGLPNNDYNTGDFDRDGYLYVRDRDDKNVYAIDVDTLVVVKTIKLTPNIPNLADIGYNPTDDRFYGIGASGNNKLYAFDPDTGVTQNLGGVGVNESIGWGAVFSDYVGHIYAARNSNGKVYEIDWTTNNVNYVGKTEANGNNDGFMCRNAIAAHADRSDGPADGRPSPDGLGTTSYGTAFHDDTTILKLGLDVDEELYDVHSDLADGDGNDDDGVVIPALTQGQSTTLTVNVSGSAGFLQGWIDWNGDGDFTDSGEKIAANLQDSDNDGTINVPLNVPLGAITNLTFARFRYASMSGIDSKQSATDGEVEDYGLTISAATFFEPVKPSQVCHTNFYGWIGSHDGTLGSGEISPPYDITTGDFSWDSQGNPLYSDTAPTSSFSGMANDRATELDLSNSNTGVHEAWIRITRVEGTPSSAATVHVTDNGGVEHSVYVVRDSADNVLTRFPATIGTSFRGDATTDLNFTYPADGIAYITLSYADYQTYNSRPFIKSCVPPAPTILDAEKTVSVWDPNNEGLYALPGNDVVYSIKVSNPGGTKTDDDSIFMVDKLPSELIFYNGDFDDSGPETTPVILTQTNSTAINFTYATDIGYSNSTTVPADSSLCNYTPVSGYDPAVTYICFFPKGSLHVGNPEPEFEVKFRAKIH